MDQRAMAPLSDGAHLWALPLIEGWPPGRFSSSTVRFVQIFAATSRFCAIGRFLSGDGMVSQEYPEGDSRNPRVHFQHLADRMNELRREQRRWRMWACWNLCSGGAPSARRSQTFRGGAQR